MQVKFKLPEKAACWLERWITEERAEKSEQCNICKSHSCNLSCESILTIVYCMAQNKVPEGSSFGLL